MTTEYVVYEVSFSKLPSGGRRPHLTELCIVDAVDETAAILYAAERLGKPIRILRAIEARKAKPRVLQEVYVVMGNDNPAAVFANAEAADEYIKAQDDFSRHEPPTRIYWCRYEFTLKEAADD